MSEEARRAHLAKAITHTIDTEAKEDVGICADDVYAALARAIAATADRVGLPVMGALAEVAAELDRCER